MVAIVEQQQIVAEFLTNAREQFGNVAKIRLGVPVMLRRKAALCRLVAACSFGHTVS